MLNKFGDTISAFRKKKGLSQRDFALLLQKRGVRVTNQAVSKWESGASYPNAIQFLIICDILDLVDISGVFNGRSHDFLRGLNEEGKTLVADYAAMLLDSGKYDDPALPPPRGTKVRTLPVYDMEAAVGKGRFLDLPDYTPMQVGNEVPITASFGIRIYGDSMEPDFQGGQIVWITRQTHLENGDLGLFIYEGVPYFKRLRDRVGGTRLQSLDMSYPDIVIDTPENMLVMGKVAE